MKRVMVVGQTGAGKTSLLKALGVWEGHVRKTEALAYGPQCIDTPGEFFDIPMFYHVLIQTSIKAAVILFLMDPLRPKHVVPNFSKTLRAVRRKAGKNLVVEEQGVSLQHRAIPQYPFPSQELHGPLSLLERPRPSLAGRRSVVL